MAETPEGGLPDLDIESFIEQFEDAHRRLAALCADLDLPAPVQGEPIDLIYVKILERLAAWTKTGLPYFKPADELPK